MLDTLEQESKRRNLIGDNIKHSPTTHISVSSSMDGTPHFASNTCASTSWGKSQILGPNIENVYEILMEVGYGVAENIGAFLSGQFCEEFNHYVLNDANVASQKPCEVVQSPNRSCHPIVDVNATHFFQLAKNIASTRKRTPKRIHADKSVLTSMEGKMPKRNILHHCSQIMKQYFDHKSEVGKCQLF